MTPDAWSISSDVVNLFEKCKLLADQFAYDGKGIQTSNKDYIGVRCIFKKTEVDATPPQCIQFKDHGIALSKAGHYHLY